MNHSKKCGEVFEKRSLSHIKAAAVATTDNTVLLCTEFLLAIVRLVRKLRCCSSQKGYYVCFSYNPTIIFSHRCVLRPWHLFFTDLVNICTEHEPLLLGLSEARMKFFCKIFLKLGNLPYLIMTPTCHKAHGYMFELKHLNFFTEVVIVLAFYKICITVMSWLYS